MSLFKYLKVSKQLVGSSPTELFTNESDTISMGVSLSLSNAINTGILATVELFSDLDSNWITIVKNAPIAKGATLSVFDGQRIIFQENDKLRVSSNLEQSLDVNLTLAYKEE